jgi:hypothetical protein
MHQPLPVGGDGFQGCLCFAVCLGSVAWLRAKPQSAHGKVELPHVNSTPGVSVEQVEDLVYLQGSNR